MSCDVLTRWQVPFGKISTFDGFPSNTMYTAFAFSISSSRSIKEKHSGFHLLPGPFTRFPAHHQARSLPSSLLPLSPSCILPLSNLTRLLALLDFPSSFLLLVDP
jgi:hypothetical protein